jgi:large subunit ribosomal protein L29
MQASEYRKMTAEELESRLQETRRELFNLRQQWFTGSLQDQNRLTAVRKDIARILTILREREIAGEN